MGTGRGKSAGGRPPEPPPVADYNVTGDPSPNCKCNYFEAGVFDGKPYYLRTGKKYVIYWFRPANVWLIKTAIDPAGNPPFWSSDGPDIEHVYFGVGYGGNPVVSAGPH